MASDDGDGGEAGQEGQTQPQKGHGNDSEEEGLKVRLSRLMESRGGSFEGDLFY